MKLCSKEKCNNKVYSKDGLCQRHYRERLLQFRRENPKPLLTEICVVENCQESAKYSNLCGKHYKRNWRHGNPITTIIDMEPKIEKCRIENCDQTIFTRDSGLCKLHFQRNYRYGRTENIKAEYGTGTINAGGYRQIPINGERVYEHIYLAEKALGKKLPQGAVVHHMNGKPADNFTKLNLVICPDQAYHLLLHKRMRELNKPKLEF